HARAAGRALRSVRFPAWLHLAFWDSPDALVRGAQGVALGSGQRLQRSAQPRRNVELGDARRGRAIEAARVFEYRGIAAPAHLGDDRAHGLLHAGGARRGEAQAVEGRVEAGCRAGEAPQLHAAASAKASISGCKAPRLVLSAAWLTIRRADTGRISSTATRPFS